MQGISWVRVSFSYLKIFFLLFFFRTRYILPILFLSASQESIAALWSKLLKDYRDSPLRTNWKNLEIVFYIKLCGSCIRNLVQEFFILQELQSVAHLPLRHREWQSKKSVINFMADVSIILHRIFNIDEFLKIINSNMIRYVCIIKSMQIFFASHSIFFRAFRFTTAPTAVSLTYRSHWSFASTWNRSIKIRYN